MTLDKPRVMIVQEDMDANTMLAGLLWLKGYEVHKAIYSRRMLIQN